MSKCTLSDTTQKKKTKAQHIIDAIPTSKIPLSKIDLDPSNPNRMSPVQMISLENIMKKYHFATECWVNQKKEGRFKMIDGEHRYLVLKKHHINTVPCKIFKVSEVQAKILRQIANKFRGQHDFEKDALEFKAIYDQKKLDELADMLVQPTEYFEQILKFQFGTVADNIESSMALGRKEWEGMPEFANEDLDAYRRILMKFDSEKDIEMFSKLIDCKITDKTKTVWFPPKPVDHLYMKRRWIDEKPV